MIAGLTIDGQTPSCRMFTKEGLVMLVYAVGPLALVLLLAFVVPWLLR